MPKPAERQHILNGHLVPESRLVVSPRDLGLLRGYGVFDFLITYQQGQPFHLADHVERLYRSASLLELDIPWVQSQIIDWIWEALRANRSIGGEHQIRMVVSGGVGGDSMTANRERPTVVIFIDPHVPYPADHYVNGAGVVTRHHCRHLPAAKSINYIEGVRGVAQARRQGGVEVVYYNDRQVFEGATSNLFALVDRKLLTPRTDILAGITRRVLLDTLSLAEPVDVVDFPLETLRRAAEVFLTASNKEVMPVTRIDGQPVGTGAVGPVTRAVMTQFARYVQQGTWASWV